MTITIEVNDQQIRHALSALVKAAGNPAPALKTIGEGLVTSTKERFSTSTGPDGERWADNAESTLQNYLKAFGGTFAKDGSLTKRGEKVSKAKKPLIGETKSLSTQIYSEIVGNMTLVVGSPMEYAAMQQFGGSKAEWPHLWGDIPARPFLGMDDDDRTMALNTLSRFLRQAINT